MSLKKFSETIGFSIKEKQVDDEKRTVVAGVLEGDFISANNRFYPLAVVEAVSKTLVGKPSLIGHETNSPRDVIARITSASMDGKRLIASFKFGTDSTSNEMFTKIKDGLVDSYSIRAFGESVSGTVGDKEVDIVKSLEMESVDLVVNGGVGTAKVLHVFESSPNIKEDSTEDIMTEEQKKEYEAMQAKIKSYEESQKVLAEAKEKAEQEAKDAKEKMAEAEVLAHKQEKLASISDEEVRGIVAKSLTGKTKEEVDAQFDAQKTLIETLSKKSGKTTEFIITPSDKKENKLSTIDQVLESSETPKEDKVAILAELMA